MGVVYDFLEALNQGVLPDHPERSESQFAAFQYLIDKSRDTLSASYGGDLILWMLDHGVEFPEKDPEDAQEVETFQESACVQGAYIFNRSARFDRQFGPDSTFQTSSDYQQVEGNLQEGYKYSRNYTISGGILAGQQHQLVAFRESRTSWFRRPDGSYRLISKTNGTDQAGFQLNDPNSLIYMHLTDVTTQASCFQTYENRQPYAPCGEALPAFVFSGVRSSGTQAIACNFQSPPDPIAYVPPGQRLDVGRIAFFRVGTKVFFPALSHPLGLTKDQTIRVIQNLPLEFISYGVRVYTPTPQEFELFGDFPPPQWFV